MKNSEQDNAMLDAIVGALPDPVFVIDENGRYIDVLGGGSLDLTGVNRSLVGKNLYEVMPQSVADGFMASIRNALEGGAPRVAEYQLPTEGDQPQWFEARITAIPGEPGQPRRVACLSHNITERKQMQNQLAEAGLLDEDDEIHSRPRFMRLLSEEIKRQGRYKEAFCLLLLDLDHFEIVSQTFGEGVGDSCLHDVARIIRQELRHSDVLGNVDGEEFGILLVNTPMNWGLEVGERIRRRVAYMPFAVPGRTLHLTVSGGLTDFRTGDTPEEMLGRATKALKKSQNAGRDRVSVG